MLKKLLLNGLILITLATPAFAIDILGGGATFPYPLYRNLFRLYEDRTGVTIQYLGIGSGKGYTQFLDNSIDFAGTDMYFNDGLITDLNRDVVHIPTCLGGVAITYNLPEAPNLNLTSEIISDIFTGKITKWNDPKIEKVNPAITLPDMYIVVVHRSDISGTTYIFTEFLSKTDTYWKENIGITPQLKWPTGVGAQGNLGVSKLVQQISGSISYQELVHALSNKISVAQIQNKKGIFVKPTLETISLSGDTKIPNDTRVSLVNTEAKYGYPISSFTWLVVNKELAKSGKTKEEAKKIVDLLWWITHEGQSIIESKGYSKLHKSVVKKVEKNIKSITYNGKPLKN
jgi:phosphate transport system substrate-binding protein